MARLYRAFLAQYIPVGILSIAAAFLCYFYVYLPKDVKLLAGIVVTIIAISFVLQVLQIVLWFIDRKWKTDYSVKVLRNLTIFCSGSILCGALPVFSILYFGSDGPALTYTIVVSNVSVIHLGVLFLNANFIRFIQQKRNCDGYPEKIEYKAGFQLVGIIVMLEFLVLLFVWRATGCIYPQDIFFIPLAHAFYGCLWIVPNSFMLDLLLCNQVVVDDMLVCCQRFLNVIKSAEEECFLCMEDYNQTDRTPQVLATCGHTMCKSCLWTMKSMAAANYQSGNTKCPFCRTGYPLNETAVETYRHKRILDKIRKQDRWKARKAWISSCFNV